MSSHKPKAKSQKLFKLRLKKGDTVMVRSGRFKGRSGKILATHPTLNAVTVEGLNVVKRHLKPMQGRPQSGEIELTKPRPVSKLAIIDPTSKRPSRIGYSFDKAGQKQRVYKASGKEIKS